MFCPPLTITFLGTGTSTGVPMIACTCAVCTSADEKDKRFRSSIMVQSEKTTIIVDTTPDFRSQMLRSKVNKVDAILITHHHKDHIAGLDDIKAYTYFQGTAMNVYGSKITQDALHREFSYVFAEHKYPGIPEIRLHDIPDSTFMVGDIPVSPINVLHHKMPVLGFRFGKFTYITDANFIEDGEKKKIESSEVLVLNALRLHKHLSHFTIQEAIDLADEMKIPQAYFTHLSHQLGKHEEVSLTLPEGRALAYDLLCLQFDSSL